jgi:2-polyprenyl-3-methyl-5-hydroxy-6-metoxy-1,4-benzoquinol methylase
MLIQNAVSNLLKEFSENHWFTDCYWPENKERVLMMLADCCEKFTPEEASILDIGCGNGYISFLLAQSHYKTTACDSWDLPERDRMFNQLGISYFPCNLNNLKPFDKIPDQSFNIVLMGEVFEHILTHALGLLQESWRAMALGSLLILAKPNPSSI